MPLFSEAPGSIDVDVNAPVNKSIYKAVTSWKTALPANTSRRGITAHNVSDAIVWLDYGDATDKGAMVEMQPGDYWESPFVCTESFRVKASAVNASVVIREFE